MTTSTVVCALICRFVDGVPQILMTKRSANLDFLPGAFEIPGGHVDPGESDQQALIRELQEELNLQIRVGEYFESFTYQSGREQELETVYFAELMSPIEEIKLKKDEIESFQWISESEIETVVTPTKPANDQELPIIRHALTLLSHQDL